MSRAAEQSNRGDPSREILLERPGPPSHDEATAEQARELVTKGATAGWIGFTTPDCRQAYEALLAKGLEFTEEPTDRSYGIDCALRDPFGNALADHRDEGLIVLSPRSAGARASRSA